MAQPRLLLRSSCVAGIDDESERPHRRDGDRAPGGAAEVVVVRCRRCRRARAGIIHRGLSAKEIDAIAVNCFELDTCDGLPLELSV